MSSNEVRLFILKNTWLKHNMAMISKQPMCCVAQLAVQLYNHSMMTYKRSELNQIGLILGL